MFTANLLAFLRVVVLWDKSPVSLLCGSQVSERELTNYFKRILLGLSILFILSFLVSVGALVASVIVLLRKPPRKRNRRCSVKPLLLASVKYNPLSQSCYLAVTSPIFVVLWVSPVGSHWVLLSVRCILKLKRTLVGICYSSAFPHCV